MARWFPDLRLADLDVPGGRLTWRLLGVILGRLPMESATKTRMRDTLELPPTDPDAEPDFTGQPWSLLNYQIQALRDDLRAANWSEEAGPFKALPVPQMKTAGDAVDSAVDAERMALIEKLRRTRGAYASAGETAVRTMNTN